MPSSTTFAPDRGRACTCASSKFRGSDSKFIETHRGLISEWLDLILPDSAIDTSAAGSRGFNRRYGLRDKPALVPFSHS